MLANRKSGVLWCSGIGMAAAVGVASAANVWDAGGGADTKWSTAANWDDNNVPASGANVTLGTAGAAVEIDGTSTTVGNLKFNRAASVAVSSSGGATLAVTNGIEMAAAGTYTLTLGVPLVGSSPVAVTHNVNNGTDKLTLSADNSGFSGGFVLTHLGADGAHNGAGRYTVLQADAANALGSGATRVGSEMSLRYTSGALASGGSLAVGEGGDVYFNDDPTAGTDRFSVEAGGMLSGTSTQLQSLTRVGTLTGGGQVVLNPGSIVGHRSNASTSTPPTIGSLGTAADLIFGVVGSFENGATPIGMGTGTPWRGIGYGGLGGLRTFAQGTVTINTTGLDEFLFLGGDTPIMTYTLNSLTIGGGVGKNLKFLLASGSSAIPARLVNAVVLGGTSLAGGSYEAFSRFVLHEGAYVTTSGNGFRDLPLVFEPYATVSLSNGSTATAGNATLAGSSVVQMGTGGSHNLMNLTFAGISRTDRSMLWIRPYNAPSTTCISQGTVGTHEGRVFVNSGFADGEEVPAFIVASASTPSSNPNSLELLRYSTANGFVRTSYVTDANTGVAGDRVKASGTLTGDRTVRDWLATGALAGSYSLDLGWTNSTSQANEALFVVNNGSGAISIAPNVDFGNAEGLMGGARGGTGSGLIVTFNGNITAANGLTFFTESTQVLKGTANSIAGRVQVLRGTVRMDGGNGFGGAADLELSRRGTFDVAANAPATVTAEGVSGNGTATVASGKTLAVTGTLAAGNASDSLAVTGTGTLRLESASSLTVSLDGLTTSGSVARLAASTAALEIVSGAKVVVDELANPPTGTEEQTYVLATYASRTGTFDAQVVCPEGIKGTLAYEANAVNLTLSKAVNSTLVIVR